MLSRLIFGARLSLFIGLAVVIASMVVGIVLGLVAAFAPGWPSIVIMRAMDVILSVPSLLLAIVIVAIIGPSLTNTIVAITVVYLPNYVRLVRASALTEKITRLRRRGPRRRRRHAAHHVPHRAAELHGADHRPGGADHLQRDPRGGGARLPRPRRAAALAGMGRHAGSAREFLQCASWIVTEPGLAILITVLSINLVGDGLRDALDPKMRRS